MYAVNDDMQILSLPYIDPTYVMNFVLPRERFGLVGLLKKLNGTAIQALLSKLEKTLVTVSLPKMKIEANFKLKEALMAMGITDIFTADADLTGITKSQPSLYVSDAVHKALIEVSVLKTIIL
ncbi:unnamed protein product [Strongylus vulgaris]|uniref:Serpin domain-containing protein n=1 Tax=Strongylus vulgaris TaxID=40348 RepID=A0A3P7JHC4_STRVU|nr:unnamed protein product [Strongylus vulgaris]